MTAAERWARDLEAWAIPGEILAKAPESPWGFPSGVFRASAVKAIEGNLSPTHKCALEALPQGGRVLDVGAGAGAASLPLSPKASRLVAVDQSAAMLDEMTELAAGRVELETIVGTWPDVADRVGPIDVAVCANVAYNVADLAPFLMALTERSRVRVVLELTAVHPQASLSRLWQHFWDLERPETPTSDDAIAVIRETLRDRGASKIESVRWSRPHPLTGRSEEENVAWARRRLCLTPAHDPEVAAVLRSMSPAPVGMVTAWWSGRA